MTPEEMEKLPKPLERTMTALELSVMEEIAERIKEVAQITPVTDWLLNRLDHVGTAKSKIRNRLKKALKEADLDIDKIYENALKANYVRNKEIYEEVGRPYLPYAENEWLQQIVEAVRRQTQDTIRPMENITQTTGFNISVGGRKMFTPLSEYLEHSLDEAMMGIATGMKTYSRAVGDVIDEMTDSGLRMVDYASGKSERIEVVARRAIMTGMAQITDKVNEKNAEELGTDSWEVDWHMGARNTGSGYLNHQSWQGKVYTSEEMKTVCGLGEMLGFAGINCYHIRIPFILGVSKRRYTDEWLEEQNKRENEKKVFRGRKYDTYGALQHQRKLERTIRKQKQEVRLLERAEADKDDIRAAKSRLQLTNKTYTDFSKEMGLRQQLERLRIPKETKRTADLQIDGIPKDIMQKTSEACRDVVTLGMQDGFEHGYTIDMNSGEVVHYTSGMEGQIFGKEFFDYLKEKPARSIITVHNHADNRGFSYSDINTYVTEKALYGNIAACHNGRIYYVEKNIKPFVTGSSFTDADLFDDVITRLRIDMKNGKIEPYQFATLKEELCCEQMALTYFEKYEVIE